MKKCAAIYWYSCPHGTSAKPTMNTDDIAGGNPTIHTVKATHSLTYSHTLTHTHTHTHTHSHTLSLSLSLTHTYLKEISECMLGTCLIGSVHVYGVYCVVWNR